MFQRQDSFATDHPRVWAAAQASAAGQLEEHGRLWTWRRVDLWLGAPSATGTAPPQGVSGAPLHASDDHWFVASETNTGLHAGQHRDLWLRYGVMWWFSLGVVAVASGLIARRQGQLNLKNHQLAQAYRALEFLAAHDPLTSALNRRAFFARSDIETARAQRTHQPMAVIGCDLDWFKKINDAHGHQVGDQVLQDFCARARAMLRTADVMARFGGEEFVIMLPDTGVAGAQEMAERLRQEIETPRDPALPHYTVSMGVAAWTRADGEQVNIQTLINRADEALYRAKATGRNRVCVATTAMMAQPTSIKMQNA